jgi:hypothetical protein
MIVAARCHIRLFPASSRHVADFAYKRRGFRSFESYCAHNFRILDAACRSAKPRSRK